MREKNNRLGVLYMIIAMFLFAASDAFAKHLTGTFHPVQVIWFRQLGLFVGVLVMISMVGSKVLVTNNARLQILRGLLAISSSLLFVYAIRQASLADAVAASFVAPFFLILLSAWVLGETVSRKQWFAVIVGFFGALIIVKPGFDGFNPALLLVVAAAAFFAARQMISRLLASTDSVSTTVAYTAITSTLLTTFPLLAIWQVPQTVWQMIFLLLLTILAAFGEILIIMSLSIAEANRVAPIHYTLIVWGTLYGYLFFDQIPDLLTFIGTAIVIAAGVFTLKGDHKKPKS